MAVEVKTEKRAHAIWEGDLMSGSGRFTLGSGVAGEQRVSWAARTETGDQTSPEELIAAAHASCFSMALANGLAEAGTPPTRLESDAVCTFAKTGEGFRITEIQLTVRGDIDGVDEAGFRAAAGQAKENCPVSQALKGNVEITLDAALA
jgi:lipoyl-dependent peroxiredoxin